MHSIETTKNYRSEIKISVIVCTYNRERFINKCIESLINQSLNKKFYEVLVINNNSTDLTNESILRKLKYYQSKIKFRYLVEYNQGLSFARNRGIENAIGEFVCFIDDDAVADKKFLEVIINFLHSDTNIGGLGGRIIPYFVDGKPKWMNPFLMGLVGNVDYSSKIIELKGKKYPIGCNMTYKRTLLLEYKMFDTNLGRKGNSGEASEEKDIYFKILSSGHKIFYLPNAIVQHIIEKERLTDEYISKMAYGIGQSEYRRCRKAGYKEMQKKEFEIYFKSIIGYLLFLFYFLIFESEKSFAIITFRKNILLGFIHEKKIDKK